MTTRVTTKGQVTIPKPLQMKYGFLPGTRVMWIERDGEIIPRPIKPWSDLHGLLSAGREGTSLVQVLLSERRAERERVDG